MIKILTQILNLFHTQQLLGLITVCHHFQDLIISIIQNRLILAEALGDRKLLLECYHPSAQYTEPYVFCDYLGTTGLNDGTRGPRTPYDVSDANDCFHYFGQLYSRFKPTRIDESEGLAGPHSDGDFQRASAEVTSIVQEDETIIRTVSLDSYELFSQLCISVAIVQMGPRRGVFLSCMDVLKKTTARVWRQWLAEESINSREPDENFEAERLIWADQSRHVGLRVRVQKREWGRAIPILQQKDDDEAVSYQLELEGM